MPAHVQPLGHPVAPRRAGRERHRLAGVLGVVADQPGEEADAEADARARPRPARPPRRCAAGRGSPRARGSGVTRAPRGRRSSAPRGVAAGTREPGRAATAGDVVGADDRPAERRGSASPDQSRAQTGCGPRAAATSTTTRPRGTSSSPQPAQEDDRVAADADVAVGQQRGLPATLPRHGVEDVASQRRRPAAAGLPDRLVHDVDAEHHVPALGQRGGEAPGAAADVERRPVALVEQPGRRRRRARPTPPDVEAGSRRTVRSWSRATHRRPGMRGNRRRRWLSSWPGR